MKSCKLIVLYLTPFNMLAPNVQLLSSRRRRRRREGGESPSTPTRIRGRSRGKRGRVRPGTRVRGPRSRRPRSHRHQNGKREIRVRRPPHRMTRRTAMKSRDAIWCLVIKFYISKLSRRRIDYQHGPIDGVAAARCDILSVSGIISVNCMCVQSACFSIAAPTVLGTDHITPIISSPSKLQQNSNQTPTKLQRNSNQHYPIYISWCLFWL